MTASRRGRGEGSINKRKNGSWYAQISVPSQPGKKRTRITISGPTKKYVQQEMRREQQKIDISGLTVTSRMTVEAFFTYWLKNVIEASGLAESTHANYARNTRLWILPTIGKVTLGRLSADSISAVLRNMVDADMSNASRQLIRTIMTSAFKHATERGLMTTNPCGSTASSRPQSGDFQVYDADQAKQFIEYCENERIGILWQTAIQTGMRLGELLALQPGDVDLARGVIHVKRTQSIVNGKVVIKVPKTKRSRRTIKIGSLLVQQLSRHFMRQKKSNHPDSEWVFCDRDGKMMNRSREPRSSFRRLMKRGLPRIRIHDLRHTYATLLLADGENAKVVSENLGHASVKITLEIYCHVNPAMQSNAAGRLDRLLG